MSDEIGDPGRFRNFRGETFDATIVELNLGVQLDVEPPIQTVLSCDLDLPIAARTFKDVEYPARVERIRAVRRDTVPDGVHQPFTRLPMGDES
jgi:hypothetical protein